MHSQENTLQQIVFNNVTPTDLIEVVRAMRTKGLIQGKDFDFSYHLGAHDYLNGSPPVDKHAVFSFYDDQLASWFTLKYL